MEASSADWMSHFTNLLWCWSATYQRSKSNIGKIQSNQEWDRLEKVRAGKDPKDDLDQLSQCAEKETRTQGKKRLVPNHTVVPPF